jgi:hypothetical protein
MKLASYSRHNGVRHLQEGEGGLAFKLLQQLLNALPPLLLLAVLPRVQRLLLWLLLLRRRRRRRRRRLLLLLLLGHRPMRLVCCLRGWILITAMQLLALTGLLLL